MGRVGFMKVKFGIIYYLGPCRTSKAEIFAKIVFGYKPLTFFVKSSNLDVSLVLRYFQ